jgi:hypothetical protein
LILYQIDFLDKRLKSNQLETHGHFSTHL